MPYSTNGAVPPVVAILMDERVKLHQVMLPSIETVTIYKL